MPDSPIPRIRVAAIIVRDGDILMARHEKDGQSYWLLPGGGVEFGESAADALVRELKEESNLSVRPGRLVMVNDSIPPDRHRHIVNLYFLAAIVDGDLQVGRDGRLVDMRFIPADDLDTITMYPDVRDQLKILVDEGPQRVPVYLGNLWRDG